MEKELTELTAVEAAAKIRSGEISSRDLIDACIQRIESLEDKIEAWEFFDPDYARRQADEADTLLKQGQGTGLLHGVPVGIKDIIDTADMPTENGSPIFAGRCPENDAALVAGLRQAGAVIMGKTVTTELAVFSPGKTRNPHNPAHTPGGSSSGSAAGVAAHMIPLSVGTQTGGSIIRPAAFCGIYGLKPTFGLVPRTGVLCQSTGLDTVGPMARSIEDIALLLDHIAFYDSGDADSIIRSKPNYLQFVQSEEPDRPKLAFVKTPAWEFAESRAVAAIEDYCARLGSACTMVELPDEFANILDLHRNVHMADIATHYGPLREQHEEGLSSLLSERIVEGQSIRATDYIHARLQRDVLNRALEPLFEEYDALMALSATGPAPKGLESTGNPIFNGLWTYLGVPALNIPHLQVDGMPMGFQIIGRQFDDARILRIGKWLDRHNNASG